MNFDLDDPLGDLLSEGDNDSFFEMAPSKKKTITKAADIPKTSTPIASKRNTKMEDLFGIVDTKPAIETSAKTSNKVTELKTKATESNKAYETKTSSFKETPKKILSTPTQNRKDNLPASKYSPLAKKPNHDYDDLSDLGFDPKNPKDTKKKVNILDDLLDFGVPINKPRPNTANLSRQSTTDTDENPMDVLPMRPRTSRPATPKAALKDPLGFFSSNEDNKQSSIKKPAVVQDWLGLSEPKTAVKEDVIKEIKASVPSTVTATVIEKSGHESLPAFPSTINNLESGLASLQQQETQLMLATQMNRQESALLEMQRKQQTLIEQQEDQFNQLVHKQVKRQAALEDTIKRQQDRISAHIQLLLSQPVDNFNSAQRLDKEEDEKILLDKSNEDHKNAAEFAIMEAELRADVKKLELEKVRLEDLLQNITSSHEQEISLMETSHKKQLKLLEDTIATLEERMQLESKSLEEFHSRKLQMLEEEKRQLIQTHEDKIKTLQDDHEKMVLRLRTSHQDELDDLRSEQRTMLENLRQNKLMETSVIQDSNTYLQTMKTASSYLENAADNLQIIKIDLQEKSGKAQREIEQSLEARENRLQSQIKEMDRVKQMAEEERKHLMDVVKGLEIKLNDITQTSTEEQWSLRQQRTSLEVEKTAFEREKEFTREQLRREEVRLQDLKEEYLAEHDRIMKQIEDDRAAIQAEKSKHEMMGRLRSNENLQPSKLETDAAVKVAQDAARQYDSERERLVEMQRHYETKKRSLIDEEMQLRTSKDELQKSIKAANAKERAAEELIQAARLSQQNFVNKLQQLQRTFQEVADRESKVAQEKIQLSQERLEIQTMRKRLFQSKCSLCKVSEKNQELTGILADTALNQPIDFGGLNRDVSADLDVLRGFRPGFHNFNNGFEINLDNIPDLTLTSDNLLDPELLLVKLNSLNNFRENL